MEDLRRIFENRREVVTLLELTRITENGFGNVNEGLTIRTDLKTGRV